MEHKRFSDQIRAAVDTSGRSRYAICQAIGLNQGAMSRFMAGKGGISLETLDRLAVLLDLSVVAGPASAPTRRPKPKPTRDPRNESRD